MNPQSALSRIEFSHLRILAVSNDPEIQHAFSENTQKLGILLKCLSNGIELIEHFQSNSQYDLIFMDMDMPYIDIWTAARAIKNTCGDTIKRPFMVALSPFASALSADLTLPHEIDSYQNATLRLNQLIKLLDQFGLRQTQLLINHHLEHRLQA